MFNWLWNMIKMIFGGKNESPKEEVLQKNNEPTFFESNEVKEQIYITPKETEKKPEEKKEIPDVKTLSSLFSCDVPADYELPTKRKHQIDVVSEEFLEKIQENENKPKGRMPIRRVGSNMIIAETKSNNPDDIMARATSKMTFDILDPHLDDELSDKPVEDMIKDYQNSLTPEQIAERKKSWEQDNVFHEGSGEIPEFLKKPSFAEKFPNEVTVTETAPNARKLDPSYLKKQEDDLIKWIKQPFDGVVSAEINKDDSGPIVESCSCCDNCSACESTEINDSDSGPCCDCGCDCGDNK
jgi:hypothetical protein